MSRLKKFTHGLISGYMALGLQVLYTFASIPVALNYLSPAQVGLWALVFQIAEYAVLVEFGLSGSISRILIDYKDNHADGKYGSLLQTSFLVNLAQGSLVLLAGIVLAVAGAPLLKVQPGMKDDLIYLLIGQTTILAAGFITRLPTLILNANHRFDITNLVLSLGFIINFGVFWICLARGFGVYSILWGQAVAAVISMLITAGACVYLGLLPPRGAWGRPNRAQFREVFAFGRDIFLYLFGFQLINASQTILVTRVLGLEAAAAWSIGSRAFRLCLMLINRMFDYSTSAFAEMMVRGERDRLHHRFRSLVILSASAGVITALGLAICNRPFVAWWTSNRIPWDGTMDILLAAWLLLLVLTRLHTGLAGQTKEFRFMRFIYFFEGAFSVIVSLLVLRIWGMPGMLVVALMGTLIFSFPYSVWRTKDYFSIRAGEVLLDWAWPSFRLFVTLLPVALFAVWLTRDSSVELQVILRASVLLIVAAPLFLRVGVDRELQTELSRRAPRWAAFLFSHAAESPSEPAGQGSPERKDFQN